MRKNNPYTPPNANISQDMASKPKIASYSIGGLIALQLLATIFYSQGLLELVRVGAIPPLYLLLAAVATVLLVIGGILLVSVARTATYVLAAAAVFSALALLLSRPLISITCTVLAVTAWWISIRQAKGVQGEPLIKS
jgi:hypothetical protein